MKNCNNRYISLIDMCVVFFDFSKFTVVISEDATTNDLDRIYGNELYSNSSRPTCSSVVYDTVQNSYYYGRSNWAGSSINTELEALVPSESLASWNNVYNCAEMDAINQALNKGSNLENLQLYTVYTKTGNPAVMCENCFYSFANGNVSNVYESGFYMIGG